MINRLWDVLSRQSVVLTAERRMGKTSVVLKMKSDQLKKFGCSKIYEDDVPAQKALVLNWKRRLILPGKAIRSLSGNSIGSDAVCEI